jgi:hypothetical protein
MRPIPTQAAKLVSVTVVMTAALVPVFTGADPQNAATEAMWVIVGSQVAEGTGQPLRGANVRVHGDTIRDVGSIPAATSERVSTAPGSCVRPGFIDPHKPFDRRARCGSARGLANFAGHHDCPPRAGRKFPASAARLLGPSSQPGPIAEYRFVSRTRDGPSPDHGRRLSSRSDARRK